MVPFSIIENFMLLPTQLEILLVYKTYIVKLVIFQASLYLLTGERTSLFFFTMTM